MFAVVVLQHLSALVVAQVEKVGKLVVIDGDVAAAVLDWLKLAGLENYEVFLEEEEVEKQQAKPVTEALSFVQA